MTHQEIEQIKDATYTQTTRSCDIFNQYIRDIDGAACRTLGDVLQTMEIAEKSYKASYSDEQTAAMWEDLFNYVKNYVSCAFGFYAAKCEEHGKRKE
jgi:hypothetical protein